MVIFHCYVSSPEGIHKHHPNNAVCKRKAISRRSPRKDSSGGNLARRPVMSRPKGDRAITRSWLFQLPGKYESTFRMSSRIGHERCQHGVLLSWNLYTHKRPSNHEVNLQVWVNWGSSCQLRAKCLKPSVRLPRHDIPGTLAIGTVRKRQPTTATAPNAQVKRTGPSMASKVGDVGGLLQNFKPLALSRWLRTQFLRNWVAK